MNTDFQFPLRRSRSRQRLARGLFLLAISLDAHVAFAWAPRRDAASTAPPHSPKSDSRHVVPPAAVDRAAVDRAAVDTAAVDTAAAATLSGGAPSSSVASPTGASATIPAASPEQVAGDGAALVTAGAPGASTGTPQAWPDSQTVADLLRAEMRVQGVAAPSSSSKAAGERDRGVRVQAIYGIGRQLMADVSIDGDVLRFRSGQEQGRRQDARTSDEAGDVYRLQRIEPPCVVLQQRSQTLRTCLLGGAEVGAKP